MPNDWLGMVSGMRRLLLAAWVTVVAVFAVAGPAAAQTPDPATDPPTLPGEPVGTLVIPAIDLNVTVWDRVSAATLSRGVAHYPGTPLPGQVGNAGLAGHTTAGTAPFARLGDVVPGTVISFIPAGGNQIEFLVETVETLSGSDPAILGVRDGTQLTLTGAIGNGNSLVVRAAADTPGPLPAPAARAAAADTAPAAAPAERGVGAMLFVGAMALIAGAGLIGVLVVRR